MRAEYAPALQGRIDRGDLGGGLSFGIGGVLALSGGTMIGVGATREHRFSELGARP